MLGLSDFDNGFSVGYVLGKKSGGGGGGGGPETVVYPKVEIVDPTPNKSMTVAKPTLISSYTVETI